jgi:hypothetical protein
MPQKDEDSAKKPAPRRGSLRRYTDRDQLAPQGYPPGKRPQRNPRERNRDGDLQAE